MKIQGWPGDDGELYVPAYVTIREFGIDGVTVMFMVDTGSAKTAIMERDAERLGIDFEKLSAQRAIDTLGIGGMAKAYEIKNVTLQFRQLERQSWLLQVNLPKIYILYDKSRKVSRRIQKELPSIIGRDLLGRKYTISCRNNEAFIEL